MDISDLLKIVDNEIEKRRNILNDSHKNEFSRIELEKLKPEVSNKTLEESNVEDMNFSNGIVNFFDIKHFENNLLNHLYSDDIKYQEYNRRYFSVGDIVGCLRKAYLFWKGETPELYKNPYFFIYQEYGKLIHRIIQKFYNFDEIEKKVVSEYYNVTGRVDAIKDDVVFDIKTGIHSIKDINQLTVYASILNIEYGKNIRFCELIYYNHFKSNKFKLISFPFDINKGKKLLERSFDLKKSIDNDIIPNGEFFDYNCKFCNFVERCKKIEDNSSSMKNLNTINFSKDIVNLLI